MPKQYACLAEVTVGAGGAANIDFTSIPSTYTDLIVKLSGRTGSTGEGYPFMRLMNQHNLKF